MRKKQYSWRNCILRGQKMDCFGEAFSFTISLKEAEKKKD